MGPEAKSALSDELVLALEFLEEHPVTAVRTLEQHNAAQVAAFLKEIPFDSAVAIMARALPAFAGHLCRELDQDSVISLLQELEVTRMVAILRYLEKDSVETVLAHCPQSRRRACQILMRYPLDQVGAWIVPNTAVVTEDFSAAEVLTFLKDATEETFSKYVFIVDREGLVKGRVSYLRLLKAGSQQSVSTLRETDIHTLSGHMLLGQAHKHPGWQGGDVLPVTGLQQQFIGVLRHADLRRGLQAWQRTSQPALPQDLLSTLTQGYSQALSALFAAVSDSIEQQSRQQES